MENLWLSCLIILIISVVHFFFFVRFKFNYKKLKRIQAFKFKFHKFIASCLVLFLIIYYQFQLEKSLEDYSLPFFLVIILILVSLISKKEKNI